MCENCKKALEEYMKVQASALEKYGKRRASPYEEYEKARDYAWKEYKKKEAPAWEEYERVMVPMRKEYLKIKSKCKDNEITRKIIRMIFGVIWLLFIMFVIYNAAVIIAKLVGVI
ncbi:MAG: hypothetical protein ACOC5T_07720 [Elusimicrobiota bacterium]